MSAKSGIYITFLPDHVDVPVSQEQSILEALIKAHIPVDHTCGGHGTCGTCLIKVVAGIEKLDPREELENEMATDRGFDDNERLACQTKVKNGLVIEK